MYLPCISQVREHPELSVGSQTEGIDVRSVGNSLVLKETALLCTQCMHPSTFHI